MSAAELTDREMLLEVLERIKRIEERIEREFLPEPLCLTYPAAAARLGVGLTKLKQMVKSRQLHTTRVGEVKMVSVAELRRISTPEEARPVCANRRRAKPGCLFRSLGTAIADFREEQSSLAGIRGRARMVELQRAQRGGSSFA